MNPKQQRTHSTRVAELEERQGNLEIVVEALAKEIVTNRGDSVTAVQGTRAACDAHASEQERLITRAFEHIDELQRYKAATTIVIGPGILGRVGLVWRLVRWVCTGKAWPA